MSVPASISKRSTYVSTSGLLGKSAGPGPLHETIFSDQKEVYYL